MNAKQKLQKMKDDPRCADIYHDSDGCWAHTAYGWINPHLGIHLIHENTWAEVYKQYLGIKPCECDDCIRGHAEHAKVIRLSPIAKPS